MTNELSMIDDLRGWGIEGSILNICADAFDCFDQSKLTFPNSKHVDAFTDFILNNTRASELKRLEHLLFRKFGIDKSELPEINRELNVALNFYAIYRVLPIVYSGLLEIIEKLDKIAHAAEKLRALLPKEDDPLFSILDLAVYAERGPTSRNDLQNYFANLDTTLLGLISTKDAFKQTQMGKAFGVGSPKRKGNLALKLWMMSLHGIWTESLKRNLKYDGPQGLNGRARFIDFCYETLVEFDPSATHHSIENLYSKDPTCKFEL